MHKTENESLWRDEMSYGSDTWYLVTRIGLLPFFFFFFFFFFFEYCTIEVF